MVYYPKKRFNFFKTAWDLMKFDVSVFFLYQIALHGLAFIGLIRALYLIGFKI